MRRFAGWIIGMLAFLGGAMGAVATDEAKYAMMAAHREVVFGK